jgi:hypothetical protein
LTFGIAGMAGIYFLAPLLDNLLTKVPLRIKQGACALLLLSFCADATSALAHPRTGPNITNDN